MPGMNVLKAIQKGFSLVELLITFGIIALIMTFTVPQLFQTNTTKYSSKHTAGARDAAFMVFSAFQQYKAANGTVPTTMGAALLLPYLNYISRDTSGTLVDDSPIGSSLVCQSIRPCLLLNNGAKLVLRGSQFTGSNTTNATYFEYDPDGVYSGTGAVDNQSKSLDIYLYYDGTIRTRGTVKNNTWTSNYGSGLNPNPRYDPSWFTGF